MPIEAFLALTGLAAAAAFTPGPNNLMLAASAVNYGFRRTVPHIAGIVLGFPVMIFAIGLGLGELFTASPALREAMRWGGAALLLWFAWRIATAGRAEAKAGGRPLTFFEAAGFQWINPKAWAMALAATAQFVTGEDVIAESALCAFAFGATGLAATTTWSAFGVGLRRFLDHPTRRRVFNLVMGLLVASFVFFMFRDKF